MSLRVMHVIDSMIQGGAESLLLEHVRHAAPGTETTVVALNRGGPALEQARALGAHTELLGKGAARLAGLARLASLMRARGIDAVNGHNPVGALYATAAATWAGVPAIVRTEHSIHYAGRHSGVYPRLLEPLLTWRAGAVVCVCDAVRRSHASRLRWADAKFVTIDNGISDAPPSRARESLRATLELADAPVALTVGSLTPQKAQHVLLDAWTDVRRSLPGARLLIAGAGALEPVLRARAERADLAGAVTFLGARQDVGDLLAAADVFVLSSVREGLSVTLLEAMRAARPVVATDIGGTADVVDRGVTGHVVAPGAAAPLAAALVAVLADRDAAARMGAAGRARWEARYRAERMVADTEALYRRLLGRRAAAAEPPAAPRAAAGGTR